MLKKIIPKLWYDNEYSLVGIRGFVFYVSKKESVKIYRRTKPRNVLIRRHDGHVGVPKEFLAFTKWFVVKIFYGILNGPNKADVKKLRFYRGT